MSSMVQESFDRLATLEIYQTQVADGPNGKTLTQLDPVGKAYSSRQADGTPGYRIKFRVDKVQEVTPNPTSIFIYNLSQDSRSTLKANSVVILKAGYGNSTEKIFQGNLSRVRTRKEGADYVTQIEAADGLFAFQNARIDQSFRTSVGVQQVVNTLIGAIKNAGVDQGQVQITNPDVYNNGIVLSGRAVDVLREVCDKHDLSFSIQDGKITILPIGASRGVPAFVLSPNTGLIGIPEQRDVGISFKALLNPKLAPFQPVILQSKFINGLYTTAKVVHEGDTHGPEWYSSVEAT